MENESLEELNLVSFYPKDGFDHTVRKEERKIRFYFDGEKLIIMGLIDSWNFFWISKTDLKDTVINAAIFKRIATGPYNELVNAFYNSDREYFSTLFDGYISLSGERPKESWELLDLFWPSDEAMDDKWLYYAEEIVAYHDDLKKISSERECGGEYLAVMDRMLARLLQKSVDEEKDYEDNMPLIDIIKKEKYLLCSDDERFRNKYIELDQRAYHMFCVWRTCQVIGKPM